MDVIKGPAERRIVTRAPFSCLTLASVSGECISDQCKPPPRPTARITGTEITQLSQGSHHVVPPPFEGSVEMNDGSFGWNCPTEGFVCASRTGDSRHISSSSVRLRSPKKHLIFGLQAESPGEGIRSKGDMSAKRTIESRLGNTLMAAFM